MTKTFRYSTCLLIIILLAFGIHIPKGFTQVPDTIIKGQVLESGSGMPLRQVLVSVSSTGVSVQTDSIGAFTISVPDKQAELIIELPGYNKRNIFILGRYFIRVTLVASNYKSMDNYYNSPLGVQGLRDATYTVSILNAADVDMSRSTTFDQDIQGMISGVRVIEHSGMPGHRTWMNIRGISSIYGKNQPLLLIDGMIHDYDYTNLSLMDGFSLNPMDIIDIEDISDITFMKNGNAYLGSTSSNGVININTEQKSEASTIINASAYVGISMMPQPQDVLNAGEYRNYLNQIMVEGGLSAEQINSTFPWLNGGPSAEDYYKYNNSTDWQKEIFQRGVLQKYHLFIKGGDEIATYNISTGWVKQNTIYETSYFSRFNLRVNGKVNITNKFSVAPNAKLSLSNSYLPNQGYNAYKNPILSALSIPPVMTINAREPSTGVTLPFLDDVGVFDVSNPVAIVRNATGTNRNYNFLSSVNAQYKITPHLLLSNLIGIDFNSTRESIFLPDLGLLQVDSAYNSPGDLASEYRSMQNHTTLTYANKLSSGHSFEINAGVRYMKNTYKNVKLIDLNTASDYLKNLGAGTGSLNYLRTSTGDDRGLKWLSYFGNISYNYLNKYYINANLSYDGNSAVAEKNRYNFYPSAGIAWRISSENFLSRAGWLEDLKLRVSWSQSGNLFSDVYDYSKLYYVDALLTDIGVLLREAIPNENMEIEKKSTLNAGVDISLFKQLTNIHFDYYKSNVNNLIILQQLPDSYGYTRYFDNGGKMENSGIEISASQRILFGQFVWTIGATFAKQTHEITGLEFINPEQDKFVTQVAGAEYVTSVGGDINNFYGFKTNGIFTDATEASAVTGPKGIAMQVGDIRYVDADQNNIINENDKTIIGDPNPEFFGGLSSSLSYKRIELMVSFTFSEGNDAFNFVRFKAESMDTYNNQFSTVLNRWTPDNTGASMPRASFGDPTGNTVFSDRWIEDASYIRLKLLTLSYNLPGTRLYKGLKIFVTASNLLTFTDYSGYDPEFMYTNDPFNMGIDYGSIPQTRSFIIGLKLGL
ncbi:MAG: SusC/RagA family TonB-linked outer membrane protein [Bacteroidales bacterium]|nr:SusC/RagA family TonB-linked outer membrane protein [Bacteroidales bacterium]